MYARFCITIFASCFVLKSLSSFSLINAKDIKNPRNPYPYISKVKVESVFKINSKLKLNKYLDLKQNAISIKLSKNLELNLSNAIFKIKKLPKYYEVIVKSGNLIVNGKDKLVKFVFPSLKADKKNNKKLSSLKVLYKIINFIKGKMLLTYKNKTIKLITYKDSKLKYYSLYHENIIDSKDSDVKTITLKEDFFYKFEDKKISSKKINDIDKVLQDVIAIKTYKDLIFFKQKDLEKISYKKKGKVLFCLQNDTNIKVNNWYVNDDINKVVKKINNLKFLIKCKSKFKNIKYAGIYELKENNCLYVNNSFCQKLKIQSKIVLIKLNKILLSGYDLVFLKEDNGQFYKVYEKWLLLKNGIYDFKLGKKIKDSILYENKKINISGANDIYKLSEL